MNERFDPSTDKFYFRGKGIRGRERTRALKKSMGKSFGGVDYEGGLGTHNKLKSDEVTNATGFDEREMYNPNEPITPSVSGKQNIQLAFPQNVEQDFEQGHYILFHFLIDPRTKNVAPLNALGRRRLIGLNSVDPTTKNSLLQTGGRRYSQGVRTSTGETTNIQKETNKVAEKLGWGKNVFDEFEGMKRSNISVAMFIPGDIKTTYGHTYQDASMNALGVAGIGNIEAIGDIAAGAIQTITDIFKPGGMNLKTGWTGVNQIRKGFNEIKGGNTELFATEALNAVGQQFGALPAAARQIVNPRMEFLYQATAPREFQYTFKMNASNQAEASIIYEIVSAFKQWSHASIKHGSNNNILRYPGEFEIEYMSYGQPNEYLNEIANCVLTAMTVDYGTDGNFQAFRPDEFGAAPVTVTMSLNFKETDMLTSDMISEGGF